MKPHITGPGKITIDGKYIGTGTIEYGPPIHRSLSSRWFEIYCDAGYWLTMVLPRDLFSKRAVESLAAAEADFFVGLEAWAGRNP